MSMTQIRLFGRLSARSADQSPILFDAGKVKDLLGYLILHRNRPHSRETLAGLLWGDTPTAQARKNLRQTLWHLQSVFDRHGGASTDQMVLIEPDWVRFNPDADVSLDVAQFETTFARVEGTPGEHLDAQHRQAVHDAVRLYVGDLLEECYEDWCVYERARFQSMYLTMLDKLAACCERNREYERGIVYGREVLRHDRASERAYRRLMRLYYLAGDRTSALRQYAGCVVALDEELGVKPAAATTVLYEQIRADGLGETTPAHAPRDALARAGDVVTRLHRLRSTLVDLQRQIHHDIRVIDETLQDPS